MQVVGDDAVVARRLGSTGYAKINLIAKISCITIEDREIIQVESPPPNSRVVFAGLPMHLCAIRALHSSLAQLLYRFRLRLPF